MSIDAHTPVIVGVGQVVQRPGDVDLGAARGPIELMVDAARLAAHDAGNPALLGRVGFVGVAGGWFRYTNPGQLVAGLVGSPDAATALSAISGTAPQDLVGLASERIVAGELDVALIVGGEARWSHQRLSRQDRQPGWIVAPGTGVPEAVSGYPDEMLAESKVFGGAPGGYALFEDRLRVSAGETIDDHRTRLAQLWAGFSDVAVANPYAWDRAAHSTEEIRDPSPTNRMIAFPYTKAMVANNTVDMGSAIIVCSYAAASSAGVARDRMVFPHVVASGHETWLVAARRELDGSPALAAAATAAFDHAGLGIDDVEHIDLYACFPSIVEMSSAALGIGHDRPLTVTGGLGFAGAPVGNSVGHAIATIVARVRDGGIGLVHGNGGQATKQSFALYSAEPPRGFARIDVQPTVDLQPRAVLTEAWSGAVTVEAATVVYDRDGPSHVLAAVLDASGARGWVTSREPAAIAAAETTGLAGRPGHRAHDGTLQL